MLQLGHQNRVHHSLEHVLGHVLGHMLQDILRHVLRHVPNRHGIEHMRKNRQP